MSLKTFDLVPVVDKVNPAGEKSKSTVQCLEVIFENLYIGTADCYIVHYCIEKGTNSIGKTVFMNRLQRNKSLGLRKPVTQMLGLPAVGQILVLVDGSVSVVNMYGLEFVRGTPSKPLLRNVNVMARNNKPTKQGSNNHAASLLTQICVGTRRKTIQVLNITSDECVILNEINLHGTPTALCVHGSVICTNVSNQYYMINFGQTARTPQELIMYEAQSVVPVVKHLSEEEFLLNGPTDTMGMIVTSSGISMHQPLTWADGLRSVAFSYPYLLVLGESTVTVHSVIDQRQKQAVSFTGGSFINDFDGHVFVGVNKSVMAFVPVPFNKQIQMLLIDKRIDEAFDLLVVSSKLNPRQYDATYVAQVRAQAAFVYFANTEFDKALSLFVESNVDPREVIVLYPMMMPARSVFQPSRPLLHNIKDLTVIVKGSKSVFADSKKLLLRFLEKCRHQFIECCEEIDTALMKLYAECNHPELPKLVASSNHIFADEALTWMTQSKRHHSLALYHNYLKQPKKALEIWHKLVTGELSDDKFPGLKFVVDVLIACTDVGLIWTNSSWVMKQDQALGADIFIKRTTTDISSMIHADQVCDFLQKYPHALLLYLEYLVFEKESKSELHHTQLVNIYVDRVVSLLQKSSNEPVVGAAETTFSEARAKLQSLLETSSLYRVSSVLQKISHYPLYQEIATLYGKMGQHQKALKILVYQLKDFEAALHYCDVTGAEEGGAKRERVFLDFLQIYLYPDPNESNLGAEHYVVAAKTLLNDRQKEFNIVSVLNILPEDWSVFMIQDFLRGSLRDRFTATRHSKVESSLRKQVFLQTKEQHISKHKHVVRMADDSVCDFCHKPFTESTAARYPNGKVVHIRCSAHKNVCPVTGQKFS